MDGAHVSTGGLACKHTCTTRVHRKNESARRRAYVYSGRQMQRIPNMLTHIGSVTFCFLAHQCRRIRMEDALQCICLD